MEPDLAAAREAARRGWSHIVTYTRADENGASLTAAGWKREATVRGRGWHSAQRSRSNRNGFIDKVRWGRTLRPTPRSAPTDVPMRFRYHTPDPLFGVNQSAIAAAALLDPR